MWVTPGSHRRLLMTSRLTAPAAVLAAPVLTDGGTR
jgi:hypothetical protein